MINIFKEIVNYEDNDSFEDYLKRLEIISVFSDLIEPYPNKANFKGVIRFILLGYSVESDMLFTHGQEWGKIRDRIFKKVGLPNTLYSDVALLNAPAVLSTIQKWLQYNNDENFTNYIVLRDLRTQMLSAALDKILKSSGEVDYDQKYKCAQYAKDLLQMMNDTLQTFIQNNPKLKESITAFNRASVSKNTVSVESFIDQ